MPRGRKIELPIEGEVKDTIDDSQNEPKVEIVAESEPAVSKTETKSADEGIEELKRRLQEAQEATARAERERNEAVQRAYQAKNEKDESDLLFYDSTLNQIRQNASILEQHYADAIANGDTLRAAKVMREMAANEAKALTIENGKQSLKERPKEQPRPLDPVEQLASRLSPRSAAWVRAHPEYATNDRLMQKMLAAHNLAVADGLAADSDDYFEAVEETLKINKRPQRAPAMDDDWRGDQFSDASSSSGGRQVAPAAIPVSRNVSPSGQQTRTVRLTAQEIEIAAMTGQTPEEYARQKQRIARELMN